MSTRANIVLRDDFTDGERGKLWFYRHSDGYPEGTLPLLVKFMKDVIDGKIRDNVEQAGGWLIIYGALENGLKEYPDTKDSFDGWKVGCIEPATEKHGDN